MVSFWAVWNCCVGNLRCKCKKSFTCKNKTLVHKHHKQASQALIELGLKTHRLRQDLTHIKHLDIGGWESDGKHTTPTWFQHPSMIQTRTLSLSLFPCPHFSHTWPDFQTSCHHCFLSLFCFVLSTAPGYKNLLRFERGGPNFNCVKWETRNQDVTVKSMQLLKHELDSPTQFSSNDNTTLASPYTPRLVSITASCM